MTSLIDLEVLPVAAPVTKPYTNADGIAYMNACASEYERELFARIRSERPDIDLSDDQFQYLQTRFISGFQSEKSKNGRNLENLVREILTAHQIPFRTQVTIDERGLIADGEHKRNKCHHIVDFVIGDAIDAGKSITEFQVVSCKTTARERWKQDDWTLRQVPLKYLFLTLSDDYPSKDKFGESEIRKIITCKPKPAKKDDRVYLLHLDDLVRELQGNLGTTPPLLSHPAVEPSDL